MLSPKLINIKDLPPKSVKNTKFLDDSRNVVLEILEDEDTSFKSYKKEN